MQPVKSKQNQRCNRLSNGRAAVFAGLALAIATAAIPAAAADAVDLDAYRGKVVLLDFWASWCVPCRRSFPWMNEMQQKYGERGLVVVAVNLDNDSGDAADFLAEYPAGFRIAYDTGRSLARAYGVDAMPNAFVIDRLGRVLAQHRGFREKDLDDYETAIIEALDNE